MIPVVVGSNPISHPIQLKGLQNVSLFYCPVFEGMYPFCISVFRRAMIELNSVGRNYGMDSNGGDRFRGGGVNWPKIEAPENRTSAKKKFTRLGKR